VRRRSAIRVLAAVAAVSVLVAGGGALPPAVPGAAIVDARQPRVTTPEQAQEADLKAIAKANGWTLAQARAHERSAAALDAILDAIAAQAPEIIVGSALAEDPEGPPTIYLKGPSPAFVDQLVADAGVPVIVVDDQPFSMDELDARAIRVSQALLAQGLGFVSVGTDLAGGTIPVSVARTAGITDAEAAAIVATLPEDLRSSVVLTVVDPPIDALLCHPTAPSSSAAPSPSASASGAEPTASPAPCLDLPAGWGPLAVVDDPGIGGMDAAIGPGRLVIGPRCVTIRGKHGGGTTLVWRAGDTRWDPATNQILFVDRDLGLIRLSTGDRVTLGGFSPPSLDATDHHEGPTLAPWIAMPDAACPAPLWEVNGASIAR